MHKSFIAIIILITIDFVLCITGTMNPMIELETLKTSDCGCPEGIHLMLLLNCNFKEALGARDHFMAKTSREKQQYMMDFLLMNRK